MFMNNESTTSSTSSPKEQVGDAWKFLKDGTAMHADGVQQQPDRA